MGTEWTYRLHLILVCVCLLCRVDVEVLEGEGSLSVRDDSEPVPHVLLSEELLAEVLDVPRADSVCSAGSNDDFAVTLLCDGHLVGEVSSFSLDLDSLLEVCVHTHKRGRGSRFSQDPFDRSKGLLWVREE